jgi:hypothetical protein
VLEDRAAIQLAISEVVGAMAQNFMDAKRGGKILYGLQLALNSMKHPQEIVAPEPVRELCQNEEGEDIGPEMTVYEEGEEFPDDEEDEEEDDDVPGEQEQDRQGDVPGISASADGNIASGQPKPQTLREVIADYISELKRRNPDVGRARDTRKFNWHPNLRARSIE